MAHRASAGSANGDFSRIRSGTRNQFRKSPGRQRGTDLDNKRGASDAGDGDDIALEVKIQLLVERSVDCIRRGDQEQTVAVGGRPRDCLGGHVAGGARPILDNEWHSKSLRQHWLITRARMSGVVPGGYPTIKRTGRDG